MKTYIVFFAGEYQGKYQASSRTSAYRLAAKDYGQTFENVVSSFGNKYSATEAI